MGLHYLLHAFSLYVYNIDPVSLTFNNQLLYNDSAVTYFGPTMTDLELSCTSTVGHTNLRFTSSVPAISDYLSTGVYDSPLMLEGNETVLVTVVSSYEIMLTFQGMFTVSLSGTYSCHSMESGVNTTVVLNYSELLIVILLKYVL